MFIQGNLQLNLGFRQENVVSAGDGFNFKEFINKLCSQEMDSVLFQVSRKKFVHHIILYRDGYC